MLDIVQHNLKEKAVTGMIWTTIQRFTSIGIQFISGIVLARLLMPEDYGAIGMLTIFMLVAQSFLDGGFGAALIQKKRPTQDDYSTIFWFNLGMSILLYLILYTSAPFIADFYHMPILCDVLRVQALVLIISALTIVQANQLRKHFKFKKIALVSIFTSIISLVVIIWMAYEGYGVWALVAHGLLGSAIPSVIYWFTNKWYPKLVFSIKSLKELFSFGVYILLTHVINEISMNIQGLLIGRFYNANVMGYYSKAKSTEKLAATSISQALGQITLPLYSELQDNKNALINMIKKLTGLVAFVTFPLMFLLILLAKPIFILLYSYRWVSSVPYFQILCFSGIALCLQSVNLQAISAIGKSKIMFTWTIIKRILSISLVVIGLLIGDIYGLLTGMVIGTWLIYFINIYLVDKHIGYKFYRQLRDLLPIFLLASISFLVAFLFSYVIDFSLYVNALFVALLFMTLYLYFAYINKMTELSFCIELMSKMFRRIIKKS